MLLLKALLAVAVLSLSTCSTSILCSSDLYGSPSKSDTATAEQAMPFGKGDPDGQIASAHVFAEPAFLTPSFNSLKNVWPRRMVQLPLIWRFKTARLALLMYADADGKVSRPILNMDWKTIHTATDTVKTRCVDGLRSGGVWIISVNFANLVDSTDLFRRPHVAVYVYESGSPFETVVTQYMISGKGVDPFNPGGLGLKGMALNVTVPEAVLGANALLV